MMEDDKAEAVAAAVDDFLEQRRQGKSVSVEAFAATHPDITAELTSLLPVMLDVEGVGEEAQTPSPAAVDFPESLGDFRLLERIGSGGMGAVFRAAQESLKREVAIKLLHPTWNGDARRCEAFENESRVIAGLRHTNIVEVYGAGHEGGFRYYVMGLVKGSGVSPKLLKKVFPNLPHDRAVATVGLQAAEALSFAHEHGVLHRDVKPGNILLDEAGVVHVSDFGLATVLNEGEDALLVSQCHDGTLRYMAPERLSKGENSFADDQYGLGLTLYELLTRRPAFADCPPGTLIRHICETPVTPLEDAGELGAIINKSISFEPSMRYRSLADMAADLRCYLEGRPVRARRASSLRRYALWCRRNKWLAVWSHAAAAMLLLFLLSLSYGFFNVQQSLVRENEQRVLAVKNARMADDTLQSLYASMLGREDDEDKNFSRADADLMQKLLPYCEELAAQGGEGDSRVAAACRTLALIAQRIEDYPMAEKYYRRALELLPADSAEYVQTLRGLCRVITRPNNHSAERKAVQQLARETADRLENSPDFAVRLELAGLLTEMGGRLHAPHREQGEAHQPHEARSHHSHEGGPRRRHAEILRAASLLHTLLEEQPQNAEARLLAVRLLAAAPRNQAVRDLLGTGQKTPLELLDTLLQESPDNAEFRRTYIQLVLRQSFGFKPADMPTVQRAANYAAAQLSESPHDMGVVMGYVMVRRLYVSLLKQQGDEQAAAREHERTVGAVTVALAGAEMEENDRRRLTAWLERPVADAAAVQQYRDKLNAEHRKRFRHMRNRPQHLHKGGNR